MHATAVPVDTRVSSRSAAGTTPPVTESATVPAQPQRPRTSPSGPGDRLAELEAAREEQLTALAGSPHSPVTTAYRASLLRILEEIRLARRRLAEGRYGRCTHCAGAIPADLLELRPWSVSCAPCAEEARS